MVLWHRQSVRQGPTCPTMERRNAWCVTQGTTAQTRPWTRPLSVHWAATARTAPSFTRPAHQGPSPTSQLKHGHSQWFGGMGSLGISFVGQRFCGSWVSLGKGPKFRLGSWWMNLVWTVDGCPQGKDQSKNPFGDSNRQYAKYRIRKKWGLVDRNSCLMCYNYISV